MPSNLDLTRLPGNESYHYGKHGGRKRFLVSECSLVLPGVQRQDSSQLELAMVTD